MQRSAVNFSEWGVEQAQAACKCVIRCWPDYIEAKCWLYYWIGLTCSRISMLPDRRDGD